MKGTRPNLFAPLFQPSGGTSDQSSVKTECPQLLESSPHHLWAHESRVDLRSSMAQLSAVGSLSSAESRSFGALSALTQRHKPSNTVLGRSLQRSKTPLFGGLWVVWATSPSADSARTDSGPCAGLRLSEILAKSHKKAAPAVPRSSPKLHSGP